MKASGELRRAVADRVFGDRIALGDLEPSAQQRPASHRIVRGPVRAGRGGRHLGPDGDPVLASHHVREATLALDELLGVVDIEEVLERVFAGFCVGK